MELILDRIEGAFVGLEISAKRKQGFNPIAQKIRQTQEKQLKVLLASIQLLGRMIEHDITQSLESVGGSCHVNIFEEPLELQEYVELLTGNSVPRSWAFILSVSVPGIPKLEKLLYIGHRSATLHQHLDHQGGASLFWSGKSPNGLRKWQSDGEKSPYALEITAVAGQGDQWLVRTHSGSIEELQTTILSRQIADAMLEQLQV